MAIDFSLFQRSRLSLHGTFWDLQARQDKCVLCVWYGCIHSVHNSTFNRTLTSRTSLAKKLIPIIYSFTLFVLPKISLWFEFDVFLPTCPFFYPLERYLIWVATRWKVPGIFPLNPLTHSVRYIGYQEQTNRYNIKERTKGEWTWEKK